MIDKYRRPSDLPPRLPVFPLMGAILLPRSSIPLRVFEPRYLALVDDVMSGNRVLGILQPQATAEGAAESPAGKSVELKRIGCAGRITSYQELDDGRYLISVTGIARFEVIDEAASDTPYRVLSVRYDRYAPDFSIGLGEEKVDRPRLLGALKNYLEANRLDADWGAITRASTEALVNALAVMSPYGAEEKQALLEAVDLKTRAEVLVALAEMDLASSAGSGGTLQ